MGSYWPCLAFDSSEDAHGMLLALYGKDSNNTSEKTTFQRLRWSLSLQAIKSLCQNTAATSSSSTSSDHDHGHHNDPPFDERIEDERNSLAGFDAGVDPSSTKTTISVVLPLRGASKCPKTLYLDVRKKHAKGLDDHDFLTMVKTQVKRRENNAAFQRAYHEFLDLACDSRRKRPRGAFSNANGRFRPTKFLRKAGPIPVKAAAAVGTAAAPTTTGATFQVAKRPIKRKAPSTNSDSGAASVAVTGGAMSVLKKKTFFAVPTRTIHNNRFGFGAVHRGRVTRGDLKEPPRGTAAIAQPQTAVGGGRVREIGVSTDRESTEYPVAKAGQQEATVTRNEGAGDSPLVVEAQGQRPRQGHAESRSQDNNHSVSSKSSAKATKKLWIDDGETIQVSPWTTIRKLLEELGHTFYDNMFCRPFGDPQKYSSALLGEDYFTSLPSYRAYLCAHGVDYAGALPWEEGDEKIQTLQLWVRLSVLSSGKSDRNASSERSLFLSKTNALKLLKTIGVKWVNGPVKDGYVLPGDNSRKVWGERDLWVHLIKHGLPSTCLLDQIDEEDRAALELCIAHGEIFDWVSNKICFFQKRNELTCTPKERGSISRKSSSERVRQHPFTPAADKAALEALTRAPDDHETSPHPGLNSVTRTLLKDTSNSIGRTLGMPVDNGDGEDSDMRRPGSASARKQPPRGTTALTDYGSQRKAPPRANDKQSAASDDEEFKVEEDEVVEVVLRGKTVHQKLRSCLSALKKNQHDKVVATGKLSKSLSRIKNFLKAVIQSKGAHADRNMRPILYICGAPGSGKTMSTRQLCDDVIEAHKATLEDWEKEPRAFYLNCSHLQNFSKKRALDKILDHIEVSAKARLNRPADDTKAFATILILDEIDLLCDLAGTENCLATVTSWASDPMNQLSIIGISNSVQDGKSRRLFDLGMGGNVLVFNTYRKEELVKITQSKIGFSVVDKKALEFIAAKVSASSGDARRYLELVCLSIDRCLEKLPQAMQDVELTKPVVTIRDAMLAIRETNVKYKDIIESLPFLDKVTLCTGVHLSRKLDSKPLSLGTLQKLTVECTGVDIDAGPEEFKESVERLMDSGLLTLNCDKRSFSSSHGMGLTSMLVHFDLQLEDVESALEDSIKDQAFFQRLVERVKSMRC